jgi:hypothetical protein
MEVGREKRIVAVSIFVSFMRVFEIRLKVVGCAGESEPFARDVDVTSISGLYISVCSPACSVPKLFKLLRLETDITVGVKSIISLSGTALDLKC